MLIEWWYCEEMHLIASLSNIINFILSHYDDKCNICIEKNRYVIDNVVIGC